MSHYKGDCSKEANRATNLMKRRQKEQEELEARKKKIEDDFKIGEIKNKFTSCSDHIENHLKTATTGLLTIDQMRARQEEALKRRDLDNLNENRQGEKTPSAGDETKKPLCNKRSLLSFDVSENDDILEDEEEEKEEKGIKPKKFKMQKCPDVDTSFLPDKEREEREARLKEHLRLEWIEMQEKIKNEDIVITYSYWDGSGHRRQVKVKKGHSVQQFLQACLERLRKEFNELKTVTVDRLVFVKEDLIIPHRCTFYDFIVSQARGKSGPLFDFGAHDDVRLASDATLEKSESHAGKVCLRSWYERNKHIFPTSRWEPYDPNKVWDKYTVSDSLVKE